MGTWGPGIFSDDLASDLRATWRDLISEGLAPEEATDRILSEYATSLADPDENGVVWLALALSQWQTGRLLAYVRQAAVAAIDAGTDGARWSPGKDRAAREKALAKARAQLESAQPPAKRISKPKVAQTPFRPGDLISYEHGSGARFLLWVSHNSTDRGGEYNSIDVLDVVGPPLPDAAAAAGLPTMQGQDPFDHNRVQELRFRLLDGSKVARAVVIGNTSQADDRPSAPRTAASAKDLDDWLRPFLPGGDRILRRLTGPSYDPVSGPKNEFPGASGSAL